MLGLTQQQLAELIGVTYQQAHKYEKGINRIAGGRLYTIAQALGVEVGFFYGGLDAGPGAFEPTSKQRLLLELSRHFVAIGSRQRQEAICNLARALASSEPERRGTGCRSDRPHGVIPCSAVCRRPPGLQAGERLFHGPGSVAPHPGGKRAQPLRTAGVANPRRSHAPKHRITPRPRLQPSRFSPETAVSGTGGSLPAPPGIAGARISQNYTLKAISDKGPPVGSGG